MSDTRIYVACLASYNAGRLHGVWVEDCTDLDAMQATVNAMLRASPEPNVQVDCPHCDDASGTVEISGMIHRCTTCNGTGKVPSAEEYAIHDHEGFGGTVEEYTPLTRVAALAEAIEEHGAPFIAYLDHFGRDSDIAEAVESFTDAYQGEWNSEQAFAENLLDDLGEIKGDSLAERYFNYEAFTRDLFMGDYWRDDSTGAVFRSC